MNFPAEKMCSYKRLASGIAGCPRAGFKARAACL
jgi:hypothetical protein